VATKICAVCGDEYQAPPSAKRSTCKRPECIKERKRQTHLGKSNEWSDESRQRLSERGLTPNLRLGTPAAQDSPLAGSFETNQEAKIWWLRDPEGNRYTIRNLRLWCKDHADLFEADGGWERGCAGIRQIQAWLTGMRKRRVTQWKGWTLERPAEYPDDTAP
jgi:hypothetical protein